MKKLLFCCLLVLAAACKRSGPVGNGQGEQTLVLLDSLERRNVGQRLSSAEGPYDSSCVRGLAVPMLSESTPFAQSGYSFVRVVPNRSYEMCRYDDHAVLEIGQGGCEYFSFVFKWSYNGVPEGLSDRELYTRALEDTRAVGRWCREFGSDVAAGADILLTHLQKDGDGIVGTDFDFLPPVEDFRYTVRLDSPERFSDAAVVSVVYAMGPL